MRKGKSLERLVRHLESALGNTGGAKIESPGFVRDKITGELREHDVLITLVSGHHTITIALECRDRKRKVGSPAVEAFHTKCEHTVDKGLIVSSSGFTAPGIKKATALGIRCLSLQRATSMVQFRPTTLKIRKRNIDSMAITVVPEPEDAGPIANSRLNDENGNIVSPEWLFSRTEAWVLSLDIDPNDRSPNKRRLVVNNPPLTLTDVDSGRQFPVKAIVAKVVFHVTEEAVPFSFFDYLEPDVDTLATTGIASVKAGGLQGSVVFTKVTGGAFRVLFIHEQLLEGDEDA